MTEQTRAAGYVRVSTEEQAEEGHSIYEQPRLIREFITEQEGWELIEDGMFEDAGYSGAREDRPDLQRMLGRLDDIDVVVVWAMDRLTRDVELFAKLAKTLTAANVRIESLTASVDLTTSEGRAMANVSAVFGQFERERIAERVRAALKARKRDGQHNGGPPPDGWMDVKVSVKKVKGKDVDVFERIHDPERADVIRHLFDLAEQGIPDAELARHLNAEGYRTRTGRPWDRRAVQNHVTNAWHSGWVVLNRAKPEEERFDGHHDPLVDPVVFDHIQTARGKRDLGAERHVKGRPARRHLLGSLARCGACGSPMFCHTSSYRRKDGSRRRQYRCRSYWFHDGTCKAKPVDAEAVDAAVLEALPRLMPDFNAWIEQIEDRHAAERQRLLDQVARACGERDDLAERFRKAEDRFLVVDEDDRDRMRNALDRVRDELSRAEVRAKATAGALALVPEDVSHDRLLDFARSLREAIAGKVEVGGSAEQVNRALIELFGSFTICRELPDGILREEVEAALTPGSLYVFPNLRQEVFMRLVAEYDPPSRTIMFDEPEPGQNSQGGPEPAPPLAWIEALTAADGKPANNQE